MNVEASAALLSRSSRTSGASLRDDGTCEFVVWAPLVDRVSVRTLEPDSRTLELQRDTDGYHHAILTNVAPDTRYFLRLADGAERPDPASRSQPDGVHGPSAVVESSYPWKCQTWRRPDLHELVIYEIHTGTFTQEGTFDAIIPRLRDLRELGITAIELMPVAQFPGSRNWGYDGVFAYAAHDTYGGPRALKRLVDAAHQAGIGIFLDVVYNHVGPEGNFLREFGPYFTDAYSTPWGDALNFDGAGSDDVRRYFVGSALQWIDEFRFDGLRIDAVHAIHDRSAVPFLRELTTMVHDRSASIGRPILVIGESDLGDPRVLRSPRLGGLGMDAQWLDDFHHALHTLLTHERTGYYADFGAPAHLANAYRNGFVYNGQYSQFRQRRHGAPAPDIAPRQFIVCSQNHDQIGNRLAGDRLITLATPAHARLAAAATILSPFTPLLFMGEEYGETKPFPYFVSHSDPDLIAAVRRGRKEEFAAFGWTETPPDPQAPDTFESATLDWDSRAIEGRAELVALYQTLLDLRRRHLIWPGDEHVDVDVVDADGQPVRDDAQDAVLAVRRSGPGAHSVLILNFTDKEATGSAPTTAVWRCVLDTAATAWNGPGSLIPDEIAGDTDTIRVQPFSAMLLIEVRPDT